MASLSTTGSLHWLLRKIFSSESTVRHWNRPWREAGKSPSMKQIWHSGTWVSVGSVRLMVDYLHASIVS